MSERVWQAELLIQNLQLDPLIVETVKKFFFENREDVDTGFDRLKLGPTQDIDWSFGPVKNAQKIFIFNTNRTEKIWYRVNGLYENIPIHDLAVLSNNPNIGRLDRLSFKSTNQTDTADMLVLILGTKDPYNGFGNP